MSTNKYYQRQVILDEVGPAGQQKLTNTTALIIGAGGLGSPLLTYLAAAGVGHIIVYDFDKVEETNLHRQTLFSPNDVGKNKAIVAKEVLQRKNPNISVRAYPNYFKKNSSIEGVDIIVDCTDNLNTKFTAHDLAFRNKKIFSMASIHKFEGQVQVFDFRSKQKQCLRCLWPEQPEDDCVQNCAQAGVIGATAGIIGTVQAMEIIKLVLDLNHIQNNQSLVINLMDFQSFKIKIPNNEKCPLCSGENSQVYKKESSIEIDYKPSIMSDYYSINIGTPSSELNFSLETNIDLLLSEVQSQKLTTAIAIFCNRGITSLKAVRKLRAAGFENSFSIRNGLAGLK